MKGVYITCNAICSECGAFLSPELLRDKNDVPTGELKVVRHARNCSLFGTESIVKLPFLPIEESAGQKVA
jgi:hypothetical protein